MGKATRQELRIPHGQASKKFQVLQTVRCLAAIREVPLGIPKQAGAKCPYFPHWLPSNHFPPENAPLYPRTKSQPAQADNQRASELSRPPVFKRGHGNAVFLPIPLSALHNQEIAGYDLNLPKLNELAARVLECADTSLCICMIEEWLLSQMAETYHSKKEYDFKRMTAAIQQILNHPETPVARLASITCLSSKQFERLFNDNVGANPKEYARIVRFQKSLGILQNSPKGISHAQLADLCGYADQSHFIREFKQFSGHTPRSLLDSHAPYSDLFTNPVG